MSHSLSAIASLSKSNGRFDLKSSRTFLPTQDGDRASNRDSIAVVEDNKVELERLVEQINSDLTSAKRDKMEEDKNDSGSRPSAIELFLSSTAQPIKVNNPAQTSNQHAPQGLLANQQMRQEEFTKKHSPQENLSNQHNHSISGQEKQSLVATTATSQFSGMDHVNHSATNKLCPPEASYAVSDDETLEILLTEDVNDTPVTDLDDETALYSAHNNQH